MIDEIISQIVNSPIGVKMKRSYSNSVELSGWVLQEPKYNVNDETKIESCSFIIYQIATMNDGGCYAKTFNVITYSKELIKRFKKEAPKNVFFIAMTCSLIWSGRMRSYSPYMGNFEIACELDIPLEPPYKKEN